MFENQMSLSFPSRSVNEGLARTAVAAFVAQLDPTVEELCDIKTALSEAVTNAVVHGYQNSIGTVYIQAKRKGDKVILRVRDKGCGIENIALAMEPLYTTCATGECAGLGFAVMQQLCDKVRVRSTPGKGTTVVLERRITSRGE
ncbi:MAG: anti-sigma F factor [Oscillospiraceae bacterium]|nr:anti-sigma F factor [Oscillospiraceae bacterium]